MATTKTASVRVVTISDHSVRFNAETPFDVPDEVLTGGFDLFLSRAAAEAGHRGGALLVLITDAARAKIGLPETIPDNGAPDHPIFSEARRTGWNVPNELRPWMTFWRHNRPTIHVGTLAWLNTRTFALLDPDDLTVTAMRCALFHDLVGVPYHGSHGGLAGMALLRKLWQGRKNQPLWRPRNFSSIPAVRETAGLWRSPTEHDQPYEHGYDANVQYLSAAGVAMLAAEQLEHRRGSFAAELPNTVGYFLVKVPAWIWADRIPHPIGDQAVGERAWITRPTLDLLHEVARDGHMDMPQVFESWTARGVRVMRVWAETIRDALDSASTLEDRTLYQAIKSTYKHGWGMMERPHSRVYRPDWANAIVATARTNLWRKMWSQGATRWPVEVAADTVWYPAALEDPNHPKVWPEHFLRKNADHLPGGFHPKCTRSAGARCPCVDHNAVADSHQLWKA